MDKHFNPDISIEKMAAFLDGNLSDVEMQNMSDLIGGDDSLKNIMDANSIVDNNLSVYSSGDSLLPQELQSLEFDIPAIDGLAHQLVTLSPEPLMDDQMLPNELLVENNPVHHLMDEDRTTDIGDFPVDHVDGINLQHDDGLSLDTSMDILDIIQ